MAQEKDPAYMAGLVASFKKDPKGPYKDIRWFCKDGTTRPPQERCPEPGLQRARYKDAVVSLAESNHIFLGQILATTDYGQFWDTGNNHSRMKQYLVEQFLQRIDDGWILRRARYYRGAMQAEDEENWGIGFLGWLLEKDQVTRKDFFLVREAARDIPHQGDNSKTQKIRALSKEISDSVPSFLDLRVKIHGQPGPEDLETAKTYRNTHRDKLSASQGMTLDELITLMEVYYKPIEPGSMERYLRILPKDSRLYRNGQVLIKSYSASDTPGRCRLLAGLIWDAREELSALPTGEVRLAALDISLMAEAMLFREAGEWQALTVAQLLDKIHTLGQAAAGCGYLEIWEWNTIGEELSLPATLQIKLNELNDFFLTARRMVEWGASMHRAVFRPVVDLFSTFEPLAGNFTDDRIRSTILLPLGECISELGEFIGTETNLSNHVMGIKGQGQARGLNPGVATGELVVLKELKNDMQVSSDKIYAFDHPPADLKPVAGIMSVSEGNMVSHVQLLARNLAIPNAVITADNLEDLRQHNGEKVFYAVTAKGNVVLKAATEMTGEEKKLFDVRQRPDDRIRVPVDRLDLSTNWTVSLREVDAGHSGILCGPKAANLGELKKLFPDHVVEGFVIPFGIFRRHMEQRMPGRQETYWEFLDAAFIRAAEGDVKGVGSSVNEAMLLEDLAILREAIRNMPLQPEFVDDLERSFREILGREMGSVPVFLRSDTNMEDLKDFTGAGLNLTLFNVLDKERILQGILDVWASPYSERSYRWRQKFLLNPLNIYPSILVIPTVNVDRSGVLITRGILSGSDDDLTVAFSRGAGGAVEGQAAESYLMTAEGYNTLLSPAREPFFTALPPSGGTTKRPTTFEQPLLKESHLSQLRNMAEKIRLTMKEAGPWDVELGFTGDRLWLFQIRPFVENRNAARLDYLKSISPDLPERKTIYLNSTR